MMSEGSFDTVHLHYCVQCWQAGDAEAANVLVRAIGQRLEHLTRKMLRSFPAVHACTETADVLQGNDQDAARWIRQFRIAPPEGEAGGRRVNRRRAGVEVPRRIAGTEAVGAAGG